MTSSHHGDATLILEVHDGHIEYVLDLDRIQVLDAPDNHIRIRFADAGARDTAHCFADLFPYSYTHPVETVGNERAADNGDPAATLPEGVDGYRLCRQCGHKLAQLPIENPVFCGDECEHNWSVSEYRGWYPR